MKHEQRHLITRDVVIWFLEHARITGENLASYPITFSSLCTMIGGTFQIAIQRIEGLEIDKVTATLKRLQLPFEEEVLDRYSALAGFLYAYHGGGIIFIEETDPEERRKFSLAHELGHFINDYYKPVHLKYENNNTIPLFQEEETAQSRQVVSARCTKRDIFGADEPELAEINNKENEQLLIELRREQKEKFKEIKANFFAAELLLPMEDCKRIEHEYEGASQGELTVALMKRFGVSRSAAIIRIEDLRLGVMEKRLF
ncbi:MAG: ImmA/IrrE family metallo-endopeptidase [bacterium]